MRKESEQDAIPPLKTKLVAKSELPSQDFKAKKFFLFLANAENWIDIWVWEIVTFLPLGKDYTKVI